MDDNQKNHIERFFVSWNKLNDGKTAFECEKLGVDYKGTHDSQVQVYWKALKSHERLIIAQKYGVKSEQELIELLSVF